MTKLKDVGDLKAVRKRGHESLKSDDVRQVIELRDRLARGMNDAEVRCLDQLAKTLCDLLGDKLYRKCNEIDACTTYSAVDNNVWSA